MNELVPKFNDSLVIKNSDILNDYIELGIDSILENETLKDIPIAKTIVGAGKIIYDIRERKLLKNLIVFLNELNSGNIDRKKLEDYNKVLNENPKKAEKELGRVLFILDQTIENEKASILGKLYRAYINQKINWDLFVEYSEMTNRLYINDLGVLYLIYCNQLNDTTGRKDLYRIERLNSLGVISLSMKAIYSSRQDSNIILNEVGYQYASIIFEDDTLTVKSDD